MTEHLECLACRSRDTVQAGRVLTCRKCEIVYYIPSVDLAAQLRAKRAS